MLTFQVIGPGRQGNYLAGYFRPGTGVFVPLADCNTKWQAYQEARRLKLEADERERKCGTPAPSERRIIAEFYRDA